MAAITGTGNQRAGKNSRVVVGGSSYGLSGGTILAFASWDITETGDDLGTENFTSAGINQSSVYQAAFGEGILGFQTLAYNIGGDWDASVNAYTNTPFPGLYVRDNLPGLVCFENVADNYFWYMKYARVRSSNNGAEAKGKVTFKASGMSQGPYAYPTGNSSQ